jgi:hypothetical protein
MAENTQGVETPETDTQESATPTEEQQTTESDEVSGDELPNEASERTKDSFDRLTNQLKEERQSRLALEGVVRDLQKPKQQEQIIEPIYDPDTGLPSEQGLTALQRQAIEASERATRAEQSVQSLLDEQKVRAQEKEDQEAYEAHPEINPTSKEFNKNLRDVTASIMLRSMIHPEEFGNKQLSHKEAGDKAKELVSKIAGNAKQQGAIEAIEQLSPKEQASLEAAGSNNRTVTDLSDLRKRTQRGDDNALMERLKRVG